MAEIIVDGVSKNFGDVSALVDVSIRVADGEFVVLLGPTGAGKTTTLRIIGGLEKPDAGAVRIGGEDVTALPPSERDVAFVFQQYSLYPHYTVFDNLAFPLRSPKRRWPAADIDRKVREIATMLRIDSKLSNRATQLSGGEMQRVAIGRALVRNPSVYLMDEPLSSLDAKLREDMRVELKRIQVDLGATLLYVTHDQIEAMTMADRIGVLDAGRLVQIGTPHEIYETPNTIYVSQRLGSPQINLMPPTALGLKDGPPSAVTAGVRPEAIHVCGEGLAAKVLAVEHLGAETVVLLDRDGLEFRLLASSIDAPSAGDVVPVQVDPSSVLYFTQNGGRICAGEAS